MTSLLLRSRRSTGACVLALFAALAIALAGGPAAALTQRMVMAPGCYTLAPGKSVDVAPYCLDEERQAPASGSILAKAPTALGKAAVRLDDGATVPLEEALARYLVQIEGLGDFSHVRIVNRSGAMVEICIDRPTVVMAADGSATDLGRIYDRIVNILGPNGAGVDRRASARPDADAMQRRLWDAVKLAAPVPAETPSSRPTPSVTPPARQVPTPEPSTCVGGTDTITLCLPAKPK